MKIVIDARMLPYTGVGRYIANILRNLPIIHDLRQIVLVPKNTEDNGNLSNVNRTILRTDVPRYTITEHMLVLSTLLRYRASLFHSMNYIMPIVTPCPSIVTIYDIIRLKIPSTFYTNMEFISIFGITRFLQMASIALSLSILEPKFLLNFKHFTSHNYYSWIFDDQDNRFGEFKLHHLYQMALTTLVAKNSKRIITVSEHSKKDIIEIFDIPESKIEVIYPGISNEFKPIEDPNKLAEVKNRYNLPDEFALYVGLWRPHKNVHGLIEAYYKLLHLPSCPANFGLVLVGPNDRFEGHIQSRIQQLKLNNRILSTGFVPDNDLPILYSLAKFLVMPSFYEGFGLPVLEAMACGTPVIVSSTSSLPEVVGEAGLLVNPHDIDTIVEAMALLLTNDNIRSELSIASIKRTRLFTWTQAALKTSNVYTEILQIKNLHSP